jgi:hypothetical protein
MKILSAFALFLFFIISPSIARFIGIKTVVIYSSSLLIIAFLIKIFGINFFSKKYKNQLNVLILGFCVLIWKILLGQTENIKELVIITFLVPIAFSVVVDTENLNFKKYAFYSLIIIFFVECSLSIFESIYKFNFFPYFINNEEINFEDFGFRSTSLWGNPLNNALCVSIIMGFIFISDINKIIKWLLLILGFISLLCFNARGATIIWTTLFLFYLSILIYKRKVNLLLILFLSIGLVTLTQYLFVSYGFGDRLFNQDLVDGSSSTRLEVFQIFNFLNTEDFLFGNEKNYLPVMYKLKNAEGIENPFMVLVVEYGIIFASIICIAYYSFYKKIFPNTNRLNIFFILSSFFLVGCTNNGLRDVFPNCIFILCCHCVTIKHKPVQ